jgi:REP element-mobilizing transposase RayT
VTFITRHRIPILFGPDAELVAREITDLRKLVDCNLYAWCIMPEHVHMLVHPADGRISRIVKQVKGRSGILLKQRHPGVERIWEKRFHDRRLRSDKYLSQFVEYIEYNPVRAGFCMRPHEWKWSSAYERQYSGFSLQQPTTSCGLPRGLIGGDSGDSQ